MRFGLVHRVMTSLLALLGILSLVTSGAIATATSVLIVVAAVGAVLVPEPWQSKPLVARLATFTPIAVLAIQIIRLALGAPLLQTTVEFAIALQIVRVATRRGAAQDQQVIILAWLHLIAGTVLGGDLTYGVCFAAFLVVAPGALVLSHLRREVEGNYRQGARDRTGSPVDVPRILRSRRVVGKSFLLLTSLLSVPIFLFTAALFVMFPRVGLSLLLMNRPTTDRMMGFSDHVDLGGVGALRSDPTIVLRVEVPGLPQPPPERLTLYLRGTALDAYDGRAWTRTFTRRVPAEHVGSMIQVRRMPSPANDRTIKLDLEPIEPPVLFLPPDVVGLKVRPRADALLSRPPRVLRGSEDEFRYRSRDQRGVAYDAYLAGPNERFPVEPLSDAARYLALPPLPPRIQAKAEEWTASAATPMAKAKEIERRLRTEYQYDLATTSGATPDPLDDFLFNSRRGHCEYFSTAMAVMLRTVGIPSRNVTGFVGGTYNRFGNYYSVRQGDAHSWVEAYIDGLGWVRFDPTPPSGAQPLMASNGLMATIRDMLEAAGKVWDRRVVRYDLQQQLWIFSGMRAGMRRVSASVRHTTVSFEGARDWGYGWVAIPAVVVGAVAAGVLWRWRKRTGGASEHVRPVVAKQEREATALYHSLERAMAAAGVARSPATPPLRHAEQLRAKNHRLARDVELVTRRYLRARFGHEPFEPGEKRELQNIIRRMRA